MDIKKIEELEDKIKKFIVHECEVYSRIVGYFRPVSVWNKGKQQEYKDRKVFKTDTIITER